MAPEMTPGKPVRWGIAIPQRFLEREPDVPLLENFVRRAEELGFDSLWVVDPIIYVRKIPVLETISLLSWTAALTSRIKLGTAVLALSLHHPYHLARGIATLDQMSGGRFICGVGLGAVGRGRAWADAESLFGVGTELGGRVGRFMENLRIMQALWRDETVSFDGRYWKLRDVEVLPHPRQRPGPPVWFGVGGPTMMRLCAQHADGWQAIGDIPTGEYRDLLGVLRRHLDEFGRDQAAFTINRKAFVAVDSDGGRARQKAYDWFDRVLGFGPPKAVEAPIAGTVDEVVDKLGELVETGVDLITLNHWFSPEEFVEQMEIFGREVIPKFAPR